jgi:hypothetical protein
MPSIEACERDPLQKRGSVVIVHALTPGRKLRKEVENELLTQKKKKKPG